MIVAIAALLLAACLSIGLRMTSGWLDHWHPMDRLLMAIVLGGLLVGTALAISARSGLTQAGLGLAFSLAPVGLFDITKWWFRSRPLLTPWLIGARVARWLLLVRWLATLSLIASIVWLVLSPSLASSPQ